ncbi:hypothetical protein PFAG_01891 [Plasmodium falciparum Santa Lucia]|uniref:Uncharacterized protein n=8 Tax=Plasmodium falciparum TaxID=5833 RepID=A0A024XBN1_PLAFC|nr:hypothetical protein PFFVO_01933 [Plasmodium falciparum Vietnam Oak-Knoll (FVO)]ETW43520.1 hypothetical protein PFNF135_02057 [Plasmodium falciparum NF135/5.C10]ETW62211.1 hypothetical protein PFMC_01903 [Plasmodium falciparum CAMP/Malaysia]EUR73350.1 hypothetical protein PFBG_01964 [Plasmodium falciparum 7G8]EUT87567.1 hypothetical protein PFAG_01891 [Plasmodium falciparum Santa Lucia]KNG76854.1 hypothetical protein PFMG_03006 [Plasmodium falciparum IGH-CR14]KOB62516.1 hypothetical protei
MYEDEYNINLLLLKVNTSLFIGEIEEKFIYLFVCSLMKYGNGLISNNVCYIITGLHKNR